MGFWTEPLTNALSKIRRIAYSLPSGVTKVRSKAYALKVGLLTGQFTLLFFTNGEEALAEVAERGARKRSGGETSFVNLPGARHDPCGWMRRVRKAFRTRSESSGLVNASTRSRPPVPCTTGTPSADQAGDAKRLAIKSRVERLMREFLLQTGIATIAGHERRKAELFAVHAAGVLASRWRILPWTEAQVLKAVRRCYRDAAQPAPNSASLADGLDSRSRLRGPSLLDLRKTRPRSAEEMEAADGVQVMPACLKPAS